MFGTGYFIPTTRGHATSTHKGYCANKSSKRERFPGKGEQGKVKYAAGRKRGKKEKGVPSQNFPDCHPCETHVCTLLFKEEQNISMISG